MACLKKNWMRGCLQMTVSAHNASGKAITGDNRLWGQRVPNRKRVFADSQRSSAVGCGKRFEVLPYQLKKGRWAIFHRPLIFSMRINESKTEFIVVLGGGARFVYSSIRASSAFICVHLRSSAFICGLFALFTARRVLSPANRALPV